MSWILKATYKIRSLFRGVGSFRGHGKGNLLLCFIKSKIRRAKYRAETLGLWRATVHTLKKQSSLSFKHCKALTLRLAIHGENCQKLCLNLLCLIHKGSKCSQRRKNQLGYKRKMRIIEVKKNQGVVVCK